MGPLPQVKKIGPAVVSPKMAPRNTLVTAFLLVHCVLGLPREYNIPEVGNNQRSQYYVLHDDGTFKYGYDTGEDHFESLKLKDDGVSMGRFGYKNEEGEDVRVEYTSGTDGFRATGSHIPQVHPDVAAIFREAENAEPFVDPLADTDGDRSFDFKFDGDEYSRDETSDSDGTVSGSYSYVDEFGNKRSYTYRAGKGIGFQLEPQYDPNSLVTSGSTTRSQTKVKTTHSTRQQQVPDTLYRQPAPAPATKVETHRNFEEANIRSSSSPSGSYSFSYDTETHSRQESGNDDNEVQGEFKFTADDGQERSVTYQSGSATGFVAQGAHLPVAPVLPASYAAAHSSAVATQRGSSHEFVDPLADEDTDASYNFKFDSDSYSRSETSDSDGNTSGSWSVLGEDGVLRTYNFRAGKETGFEVEEVSATQTGNRGGIRGTTRTASTAQTGHSGSRYSGQSTRQSTVKHSGHSSGHASVKHSGHSSRKQGAHSFGSRTTQ